jgi:hypothetical protein
MSMVFLLSLITKRILVRGLHINIIGTLDSVGTL